MRATALIILIMLMSATPVFAQGPGEVTGFGSNPGNLQMFRYVPPNLPRGRPLVVALHGCSQDAVGYGTNSGWVELADRWNFGVVLPQQQTANNSSKCFNWFEPADTSRGRGEAESIAQMIRRTINDTGAGRVYVSGLSAGGAMTAVMMATYPEMFTGGGIIAGLPYGCASSSIDAFSCMNPGKNLTPAQWGAKVRAASSHTGPWPSVSIWHGTADYTVAYSNQRELAEQWSNVGSVVSTRTFTGMGHGQPVNPGQCGRTAPYMLDVNVCAAEELGRTWNLAGAPLIR
jgi:poly(hydroxyalkanoate) depolymerase family esterase